MIQITAIIYTFAVVSKKEAWWKWIALLKCAEVALTVILALSSQIPAPLELAYIAPFTSQATAIRVIYFASQGISRKRVPKQVADHLLVIRLFIILVLAIILGLSLARYYIRLMLIQWILYMVSSTVGYRLPESPYWSSSPTIGDSEVALSLNGQPSFSRSLPDNSSSPYLDGHQSPPRPAYA